MVGTKKTEVKGNVLQMGKQTQKCYEACFIEVENRRCEPSTSSRSSGPEPPPTSQHGHQRPVSAHRPKLRAGGAGGVVLRAAASCSTRGTQHAGFSAFPPQASQGELGGGVARGTGEP